MLVLTRRAGESLVIGDNIEICIVDIQGEKVKIGIMAPKDISIFRKELLEEVKGANVSAAETEIDLEALAEALKK